MYMFSSYAYVYIHVPCTFTIYRWDAIVGYTMLQINTTRMRKNLM